MTCAHKHAHENREAVGEGKGRALKKHTRTVLPNKNKEVPINILHTFYTTN